MKCDNCWNFPCLCGEQFKHLSTKDLKQILAVISVRDNRELWKESSAMIADREEVDKSWEGVCNQ